MQSQFTHLVSRYWHTLRHLRPVQIYGRAWHRLHRPRVDTRPAPDARTASGSWVAPIGHPAAMTGPSAFRFLNRDGHVEDAADWNTPEQDKLWLYNLHYFDDLNAHNADERRDWHRALIERWIAENPAPIGNGWEPYPLSLRIVNWIKWALAGNELSASARHSLAVQTRYLRQRLEWHLLGNHLFANAKALVFAGFYFDGAEADQWLDKGLAVLARELPEQILPDGGHFELSPMYHSILLEDMLDLVNLADGHAGRIAPAIIANWRETAQRMRAWLAAMCHPDGEISFFNDATFGIAPAPQLIDAYAERLGLGRAEPPADGVTHLKESGYIRVQRGELVVLIDVARIGPDYIPGHAHADTLSFELSLHGRRVIVNSGISQYGSGPQRQFERSTAAHSTLEVDGENSSEVWGGFRVARRARPVGLHVEEGPEAIIIRCSHDGYRWSRQNTIHSRDWRIENGTLSLTDRLSGRFGDAVSRIHLHPDFRAVGTGREAVLLNHGLPSVRCALAVGQLRLSEGQWYPRFNVSIPNVCVEIPMVKNGVTQLTIEWI